MSIPSVGEDRRRAKGVALVSLFAAIALAGVKAVAGLLSGSIALLSEAAHSGLDAVATAITYFAVRIASRPPDEEHPYGHGKAENLAALVETLALFLLAVFLARESIARLGGDEHRPEIGAFVFASVVLSILVDATRAKALREAGRKYRSPALEADALNFTADLLTSSIVLVGLVAVKLGFTAADAIGGLGVSVFVAISSFRMGRKAVDALMDRAPEGAAERIERAAEAVEGVSEVRRVRLRDAGGHLQSDVVIAISRTVPLETAHRVTEEVERAIGAIEPGTDVLVHVEPLADEALTVEKVMALAARHSKVQQVHNVFVAMQPDGLIISLHAKFPETMAVDEAHAIADQLEAEIAREIDGVARVDTHLEPLEHPRNIGSDVTGRHEELVSWATDLAEDQPEVQKCHEVLITETTKGLSIVMHCNAVPGLSVGLAHEASTRIENEVHRYRPVERVTVHFEPTDREYSGGPPVA
jgi:cation diffusion facilitator family transporter